MRGCAREILGDCQVTPIPEVYRTLRGQTTPTHQHINSLTHQHMKIRDVVSYLSTIAPPAYQESYDNAGLITGDPGWEVRGALVTLDCTEPVVDEAIEAGANLIVAHHPILFRGIKRLTGGNYVERTLIKAIKNDIAIFAMHTNLDNVLGGVNSKIAEKIGLVKTRILQPKKDTL